MFYVKILLKAAYLILRLNRVIKMKIVIDISNEDKAKHLIDILKDIPYVKNIKVETKKKKKKPDFKSVFGIWENREISVEDIRAKAWRKINK